MNIIFNELCQQAWVGLLGLGHDSSILIGCA